MLKSRLDHAAAVSKINNLNVVTDQTKMNI